MHPCIDLRRGGAPRIPSLPSAMEISDPKALLPCGNVRNGKLPGIAAHASTRYVDHCYTLRRATARLFACVARDAVASRPRRQSYADSTLASSAT